MPKILGSGAEAIIYDGSTSVKKTRIKKNYRISEIDLYLRKSRTRHELKVLSSLQQYNFTPKIIHSSEYEIDMEKIKGDVLKNILDKNPKLSELIGKNLAIMHNLNIIHGDLTTSNMILAKKGKTNKLYFIDFGLGFFSTKIEDKAVDIHLFKQALESKHYRVFDKCYKYFLKSYAPKNKKEILNRLDEVETRGRYKEKT